MARQDVVPVLKLAAVAVFAADPAAPENNQGKRGTVPANVVDISGAFGLVIDADGSTGSNGAATLQPMAFNEKAQKWFDLGAPLTLVSGAKTRFVVTYWTGRFAFVKVSSVTNTVDLYLGGLFQDGGS